MNRYLGTVLIIAVLALCGACGDDDPSENNGGVSNNGEANQAPTAEIEAPDSAVVGDEIALDASASSDPEGETLQFSWTLDTPPDSQATLADTDTASVTLTADVAGSYTATLTVSDGELESEPATATIVVAEAQANQPPTAVAGADQSVAVGAEVTLDASSSSDPDGDDITHSWAIDSQPAESSATLTGADTDSPTFTADAAGDYVFTLTVSDGELEASDTTTVSAQVGDVDPTANAGDDQVATVGETVTLDASASTDPEDDLAELSFTWSLTADPSSGADALSDINAVSPTIAPSAEGTYTFEVEVEDTAGNTATDSVDVVVSAEDCLIISEYIEGSSNNKALEIYNCGTSDLDLTPYHYCQLNNDRDPTAGEECTLNIDLTGTLAAGAVQTICNTSFVDTSVCDVTDGFINFNGDDRLMLFLDDGNGLYDHGTDTIVDAFGQIAVRPGTLIWGEVTLDRCYFAPYDGVSAFEPTDYYEVLDTDTVSGLGTEPSETCVPAP